MQNWFFLKVGKTDIEKNFELHSCESPLCPCVMKVLRCHRSASQRHFTQCKVYTGGNICNLARPMSHSRTCHFVLLINIYKSSTTDKNFHLLQDQDVSPTMLSMNLTQTSQTNQVSWQVQCFYVSCNFQGGFLAMIVNLSCGWGRQSVFKFHFRGVSNLMKWQKISFQSKFLQRREEKVVVVPSVGDT